MARRFYTRRFINKRGHHAGGYILAFVEDTSKRKGDDPWIDVEFTIADCGRQISLSFDVASDELPNSLHKIDLLLDTMSKFRTALVEEGRLAAEREARAKAGKKAKKLPDLH